MSHFFVMVLIPGDVVNVQQEVERRLAPFQENNMGDCPKQYLAFNDTTEEMEKEYAAGTRTMRKLVDGSLCDTWDERFSNPKYRMFTSGRDVPKYIYPADSTEVEVPMSELYKTFSQFAEDYHGKKKDPELGRYGYWENPSAKWDWWCIGGRWDGAMEGDRYRDANNPCAVETTYKNVVKVSDLPADQTAFAILTPEGEWAESGKMGWWAMVSDEKDAEAWKRQIHTILAKYPDHLAVGVDCHI